MSIKILSPRLIFKNQIYSRNIYVFLLMLIIILLTSIVTIIVSNVSSKTSRDLNLFYTTEAAAKFDSYISRNLILVQNTSLSKAVCDWFTDEENPDKKLAAFDQIMHLNNMLPDAQLYLSISNSLNEYSIQDDLTAVNNLVPLDKLDWSIPADRRYFNCIASGNEYTFSIGMEKLTQKWLFWINYKVIDGGNVVGTLCAGLKMQPLFDDMFGQFNNNDIRGFIIDNRGVIQMDSDFPDFITDENGTHIHTVSSDPAFITTVDAFLDSINGISDTNTDPEVVKLTKGPYEFASVAQINDSEWSVIVLTNGYSLAGILDCMPLLITVLAGFFLYMIANNILIGRLVIKPLGRLKETLPEPGTDGSNIFGYERSDEIGDLARGIRKISDRVSINQTENEQRRSLMHAINNAASILLLAEVRENFKASLMSVMELMGTCVDIDRINIWRNEEIDGENSINCQCEWLGSINRLKNTFRAETKFPYDVKFFWEEKIRRGECINGSVSGFSKEIQEFLQPYEIKSILVVPIHIENHFWGFFSFDDCRKERIFTEDEVNVLNSASLMMVNAVNRNEQANKVLEAHQRTKLIMDAMPLCTNLWDRNLRPFDCNEEAVKLYNMADKQEFLDRFFDLSPEYQPDGQFSKGKALMLLQKAFDEGKCTFEWMHQQLDGTPMPSEVTLVRVSYDEGYAVVSYIRDLREYKQMMKEIEQRDRLLHAVNETATILLQAEYEKIGYYLQYCMGMLGEAVGVDRVYLWRNHTKDGELYCTQMYEWSEGAEPLQDSEYTVDVSYNEKCPEWKETLIKGNCINDLVSNMSVQTQSRLAPQGVLSVLIVPVFLRNEFWGFLGFDDCHTKRVFSKNAESILRSASLLIANVMLRNDMTESIRTSAVQLEAALKEARSASEAKSNFLASMSHEMRTPLNAIVGLSQITLEAGGLNDESTNNLDKIFNAGLALLNTANDILDISRIEAGKLELVPVEYDIPSLINNTVTQSIVHRKEKPVKFILDIEEDLPVSLYGDDLRIRQILNNLLSNAFKYTKEGTVELGVRCSREANTVWMTTWVRDTGIGIRAEHLDSLFTDYVKLDAKVNRGIEGSGLGLPIAKRLAELMEGTIIVESEYGKGSCFTVKLRQRYVNDAIIGPDVVKNLKNLNYTDRDYNRSLRLRRIRLPYARVLIVDDTLTNLDVARGLMKPYGMQIDCVTSGQEAIDAIRRDNIRYNAVFMDHMMPGMDGIEATRIIREDIGTDYAKTVPIIALTANAIVGNEEMFLREGFQAFLSKPLDIRRLDAIIHEWVRDKELEKKFSAAQINLNGEAVPDIRAGKERRTKSDRRSGIDRRTLGWKISGLDIVKAIKRYDNDTESYRQILHSYAVNTLPLLDSINEVTADNLGEYAIKVHGIKSSSWGIGADALGTRAESLEKAAKNGELDNIKANNPSFLEDARKLILDIEDMLEKIAEENPRPQKDKPDIDILLKLLAACEDYKMDDVDDAMKEIESFEYTSDEGLSDWLRENVEQMNITQIKEKLLAITRAGGSQGNNG